MRQRPLTRACWPSRQQRLLLQACLGHGDDAIRAYRVWSRLADLDQVDLASQRLIPLLYRNLRGLGETPARANKLRGVHRYWWFRNSQRLRRLAQLASDLEGLGLGPITVLKGATLASRYYPDVGCRPMNDLDIHVHVSQVPGVYAELERRGFVLDDPWLGFEMSEWSAERPGSLHAANLRGPGSFGDLDLHWRTGHDTTSDFDAALLEQREQVDIAGVELSIPAATDLLLLVIAHGVRLNPVPAIWWIADAAYILRRAEIDWPALAAATEQLGIVFPVRRALHYLERHFGLAVGGGLAALPRGRRSPAELTRYLERTYFQDGQIEFSMYRIVRDYVASGGRTPLGLIGFCARRWNVELGELPFELGRRARSFLPRRSGEPA